MLPVIVLEAVPRVHCGINKRVLVIHTHDTKLCLHDLLCILNKRPGTGGSEYCLHALICDLY